MSDYESRPGCGGYERKALDVYAAIVDDESLTLEESAFLVACVRHMDGMTGEVGLSLAKLRAAARLKSDKVTRNLADRPHVVKYFGWVEKMPGRETRLWLRSGITRRFAARWSVGAIGTQCVIVSRERVQVSTELAYSVQDQAGVPHVRTDTVETWVQTRDSLSTSEIRSAGPTEHVESVSRATASATASASAPASAPATASAPASADAPPTEVPGTQRRPTRWEDPDEVPARDPEDERSRGGSRYRG